MRGKRISRRALLVFATVLTAALFLSAMGQRGVSAAPAAAGGNSYYVALTGSDSNPGTQAAPFKSFARAASVLAAGDNLFIAGGIYGEALNLANSGAAGAPITVQPISGAMVIIDLQNQGANNLSITGSYVTVLSLEIRNSNGYCVNLQGTHNTIQNLLVHDCNDMGIFTDGQDETIRGNTVYHASKANSGFAMPGGWTSGIKVRVGGDRILIEGNTTFNNWGEGIAVTRASNVTVRSNVSYDNYSVNIYIDNSHEVLVERNFTFDHPNNGFGPSGSPCDNIGIGEEPYEGWGAQLSGVTVINNVAYNGSHGVAFYGNDSGAAGGGLKNSTIAFNTLWSSVNTEIYIVYDSGQSGNLIANNIVQQSINKLALLDNAAGITFSHNFWVNALPPSYARGAGDKSGDVMLAAAPGYSPDNFRLQIASPAIDAGIAVSGVTADFAATNRPAGAANDIGAFESAGGGAGPTPTSTAPVLPTATIPDLPTATSLVIPTATQPVPPTSTSPVQPTATSPVVPTATSPALPTATQLVPPTATAPVLPTATSPAVPTATSSVAPTATQSVPPTGTSPVQPTAASAVVPTATQSTLPTPTLPPPSGGALTLSASSVTFADQLLGTTSGVQTVKLSNPGGLGVSIAGITAGAPFVLGGSTNCPASGGSLAAGATCLIRVKFMPSTAGVQSGLVSVNGASGILAFASLSGNGVSGVQLVQNPGFETDADGNNQADNWTFAGTNPSADMRDCSVFASGACSVKLVGNGATKTATETFAQTGVAGDDFTFTVTSKASKIPTGSTYRLEVKFYSGSTLVNTNTLNFASGTHDFQTLKGTYAASAGYNKIVFQITLKAASGAAWFDTTRLYWAP